MLPLSQSQFPSPGYNRGFLSPRRIHLEKPAGNYYPPGVKITEKMKREVLRALAASGGKARAKKYDKKTLAAWGRKGGRPRKKKETL
jgi:hypothetical protein